MAHWAAPGVKCVCVSDDFSRHPPKKRSLVLHWPVKGVIYTVRRVRAYPAYGVNLLLEELRNPWVKYGRWNGEPQFSADRFKPFSEPDDVSLFAHHLRDVTEDA